MSLLGAFLRFLNPITHAISPVSYDRVEPVDEKLLRGSKQTLWNIARLHTMIGLRSVVSLNQEDEQGDFDVLRTILGDKGVRAEWFPIEDNGVPTPRQIDYFIDWVRDPINQPCLVHCRAGKGRTGVMVACWKIYTGVSLENALADAVAHGLVLSEQQDCIAQYARRMKP